MNRTEQHRKTLAAWLAERDVERILDEPVPLVPTGPTIRYDQPVRPREGEVYLLPPRPNTSWGPVYILVLTSSLPESHRIAPFSRYATPAIPGEMITGHAAPPLRVLCLWNARDLHASLHGWKVAKLSAREVTTARQIDQGLRHGGDLPENLASRIGPPLLHPGDPRHDYLDDERERLDQHLEVKTNPRLRVLDRPDLPANDLLAAEDREIYDPETPPPKDHDDPA